MKVEGWMVGLVRAEALSELPKQTEVVIFKVGVECY